MAFGLGVIPYRQPGDLTCKIKKYGAGAWKHSREGVVISCRPQVGGQIVETLKDSCPTRFDTWLPHPQMLVWARSVVERGYD